MECQKEKKEHKSMSAARKKKTMKEVDNKKKKHGVGEETAAVVVAEDNKRRHNNAEVNNVQGYSSIMGVDYDSFEDWRVWWRPGVLVDEQMSWGSVWFSYLDEDANCHAFYSDVVEDDLWDLKSIQHTPQSR